MQNKEKEFQDNKNTIDNMNTNEALKKYVLFYFIYFHSLIISIILKVKIKFIKIFIF